MVIAKTPKKALTLFGTKRTANHKGVTIPSQKRFVQYFELIVKNYLLASPEKPFPFNRSKGVTLKSMRLVTIPRFDPDGGCDPYFIVYLMDGSKHYDYRDHVTSIPHSQKNDEDAVLNCEVPLRGNIKFVFFDKDEYSMDDEMFHFWINTEFLSSNGVTTLHKLEIDDAHKDKKHKKFKEGFCVEIKVEDIKNDGEDEEDLKKEDIPIEKWDLEKLLAKMKGLEKDLEESNRKGLIYKTTVEELLAQNEMNMEPGTPED